MWKEVLRLVFDKRRGKRQKEVHKLSSQFRFLLARGPGLGRLFWGQFAFCDFKG